MHLAGAAAARPSCLPHLVSRYRSATRADRCSSARPGSIARDGDAGRCVEIKRLRRSISSSLRSWHLLVVNVCWHCIATEFSFRGLHAPGMFCSCLSLCDRAWNHVGAAISRLTHPNSAIPLLYLGIERNSNDLRVLWSWPLTNLDYISSSHVMYQIWWPFYLLSSGFAIYASEWTGESGFDYR